MPRSASILACLCLLLVSCAEGGGATIPLDLDSGTSTGLCGDGFVDTSLGEVCECPMGATGPCVVNDKSCSDVHPGEVGTLLCNPGMCMYDVTMCMAPTAGMGGGGAGG